MENGIDESVLYERVPLTLAKTEKAIGKKLFADCAMNSLNGSLASPHWCQNLTSALL